MTATPTVIQIVLNYAPISMVSHEHDGAPEPKVVQYQNNEFTRTWSDEDGLDIETVFEEFEVAWRAFERKLRNMFNGLVVFQRKVTANFPMGEAAIVISAEKYSARTASRFGVLTRDFCRDRSGQSVFQVSILDHPGETNPIALSTWLQQAKTDIKWSLENTHLLGTQVPVRK